MRIVMEMVTAKPENANAPLIMSMHKIARIMDVSTYSKPLCFCLLLNECINTYYLSESSWIGLINLGLQVRCRELDIFKILEIFWEIVWKFFGGIFWNFLGIFWEEFF